jgi:hypothetical protein
LTSTLTDIADDQLAEWVQDGYESDAEALDYTADDDLGFLDETVAADTPPRSYAGTIADLAAALGMPAYKVYRLAAKGLIPGVHKTDPNTKKSHWDIPDVGDSVRRWRSGERKGI